MTIGITGFANDGAIPDAPLYDPVEVDDTQDFLPRVEDADAAVVIDGVGYDRAMFEADTVELSPAERPSLYGAPGIGGQIGRGILKAGGYWSKLSPMADAADNLGKALDVAGQAIESSGQIPSTIDELNLAWATGIAWRRELVELDGKDVNDWLGESTANVFDGDATRRALTVMEQRSERLDAVHEAAGGMQALVNTIFLADNMDVKGIAKSFTSLKALDYMAQKEAVKEFGRVQELVDRIRPDIDLALETMRRMIEAADASGAR